MHGNGFGEYGACPYADSVEMPQEIRDKITEAQKAEIDMRALLMQRPVDKAKAQALHAKLAELRREISEWYFSNELDYMEKPVR